MNICICVQYLYTHIYIYIYMYIYIFIYTHKYISVCVYIYICIYIYIHKYHHVDTPKGVDDGVGRAISDLLGSIFQNFGEKKTQNKKDGGEECTEPQGVRQVFFFFF
jgi:hypothetical protein